MVDQTIGKKMGHESHEEEDFKVDIVEKTPEDSNEIENTE